MRQTFLAGGMLFLGALGASSATPEGETLAHRLYASYERIKTVSCEMRKTTRTSAGTVRLLSRVSFRNPDCLHVENVSPHHRRIVADGKNLYYYEDDAKAGFSRPIPQLTDAWLASLRNIPATPVDHLTRLKDLPEVVLPPTPDFPRRAGYEATNLYVVLSCDSTGRLARLDFYPSAKMEKKTASYEYSNFTRVDDDCWIPCTQKATISLPEGEELTETRLISDLAVNTPIPDTMFAADLFFKNVEFTDQFDKTYAPK